MAQQFAKKTSDGRQKALECTDDGDLRVAEITKTLSAEMLTMNGAAQDIPLTTAAQLCILTARLGDIYYAVDDDAVSESGGYIPEGASLPVYLAGITQLSVIGASGAFCHYALHGRET